MKQLFKLTWSEFLRMLRAPSSLYFFLGVLGFLGFIFWLTSTWQVSLFVDFAYLIIPLFFVPLAATLISGERESGFAGVLFTHPISMAQYYVAKFLALLLVAGLYLLVLIPFDLLIITYAGPGWAVEILRHVGWTLIAASFATALGLLISTALGRRATLPSISLGFAMALLLVFGPFLTVQYLGAFDPSTVNTVLALMHVSPLMSAMDAFGSHGLVMAQPLYPLLLSIFLAVFLLLAGLTIYRRLQSPEGWEAHMAVRVGTLAVVVAVLVVVPLVPPYDYTTPEVSGSNCVEFGTLFYCSGISGPDDPDLYLVGTEVEGLVRLSIDNDGPEPILIQAVSVHWESQYLAFNATSVQFTSVMVPSQDGIRLTVPVRITILRSQTLGPSFFDYVPILIELEADGQSHRQRESFSAVGPEYNRDTAWLVVAFLVGVAAAGRAIGLVRRRRR